MQKLIRKIGSRTKAQKEAQRRWDLKYPGKAAKRSREWRKNNRQRNSQINKEWRLEHLDYLRVMSRKSKKLRKQTRPWIDLVEGAKQRARAQGLPFNLSEVWAKSVWTGKCALTGITFVFRPRIKKKWYNGASLYSASIDRIRPRLGYTKKNCRFILTSINWFKNHGSDLDILRIATELVKMAKIHA